MRAQTAVAEEARRGGGRARRTRRRFWRHRGGERGLAAPAAVLYRTSLASRQPIDSTGSVSLFLES
jgi:hypothetical protein